LIKREIDSVTPAATYGVVLTWGGVPLVYLYGGRSNSSWDQPHLAGEARHSVGRFLASVERFCGRTDSNDICGFLARAFLGSELASEITAVLYVVSPQDGRFLDRTASMDNECGALSMRASKMFNAARGGSYSRISAVGGRLVARLGATAEQRTATWRLLALARK